MNIFTGSPGFTTLSWCSRRLAAVGKQFAPITPRFVSNYIGGLVPQDCWGLKDTAAMHFLVILSWYVQAF